MNIFKRRIFKLLPWLIALLLLIPLKMVHQRNLDRALLRALSDASRLEEDNSNVRPVEALLSKGARHDAQADLFIGILRGSVAEVRAALDNGAKVNGRIRSCDLPLNYAIGRKHPDVLRVLIERGANVNVAKRSSDEDGITVLYYSTPLLNAVQVGDVEAVRLLLSAGVEVNATPYGDTALDRAPWTNEGDAGRICRLLLDAGAKSFIDPKLRQQMLFGAPPGGVAPSRAAAPPP